MTENPLQRMTEDELWSRYKTKKEPAIRDAFIRQYAPLVKYVAGKVAASMPNTVEFEDLVGFGVFGLLDAIEKFDPDKNVKFKTYASRGSAARSSTSSGPSIGCRARCGKRPRRSKTRSSASNRSSGGPPRTRR